MRGITNEFSKYNEIMSSAEAFVVGGEANMKDYSLQQSFLEFKKRKQKEIKEQQKLREIAARRRAGPNVNHELRQKFLKQAKSYIGTPYAQKYWSPEDVEFSSPLFLDCCGLIRRVMCDLKEDFGFQIGSMNQAYQFDTLPITVESKDDLKPGDLVFIAATYYNPKAKKQKHDIVHVEIWLGEGDKTIGARWQKGTVQVHDSYMFEAKSYHTPTYIFKSLDTWLAGICQSFCEDHPWESRTHPTQSSRSVFYSTEAELSEESAGDTDDESLAHSQNLHINANQTMAWDSDEEAVSCIRNCNQNANQTYLEQTNVAMETANSVLLCEKNHVSAAVRHVHESNSASQKDILHDSKNPGDHIRETNVIVQRGEQDDSSSDNNGKRTEMA